MRYIFITLVLVNLALALWGGFFLGEPEPSVGTVPELAPVLKTVSQEAKAPIYSGDEESPARRMCELVGPFADDPDAAAFVERLRSIDIEAKIEQMELPAGQSYWVHLAPEDSEQAAYRSLASLQAQGVESYVIAKGQLKNAISLGVFTYIDLANKRVESAKELGLDAQISTMKRTQIETWVVIEPVFAEKMSELTWERMLQGMSSQERRQNFCLPVAS
ncbi:SPOR domain-containing protein [Agaribacterium haliotis]|uniref:SPOR domain-containing protein n=1 Tax=Agaribacterium haliotis TaxID=2013869 RepID=UPI001177AE34|nr:SPOR domain-containing protein [Agaribacterium haliotis]